MCILRESSRPRRKTNSECGRENGSPKQAGNSFGFLGEGWQPSQRVFDKSSTWISAVRVNYETLSKAIALLTEGETDAVALMATVACEVHHSDDRFDWTGFYRVVAPELLKIGPYQGGHGCLEIPFSRGVCGAAARLEQVQLVPDVHAFEGHIACASSTQSELVLPVFGKDGLIGVFDIDSNQPDAFTQEDADQMTAILQGVFEGVSL